MPVLAELPRLTRALEPAAETPAADGGRGGAAPAEMDAEVVVPDNEVTEARPCAGLPGAKDGARAAAELVTRALEVEPV